MKLFNEDKPLELLTDAAGNYSGETDHALRQNNYVNRVCVYAPGYAMAQVRFEASGNVITLDAGVSISGTVTDPAGKALAGVPVRMVSLQDEQVIRTNAGAMVPDKWRTRLTAISGADGAWTLSGMPRTGIVSLALDRDRWMHDEQIVTLLDGNMPAAVHFTTRPGAIVTGRVLSPEGAPAAAWHVGILRRLLVRCGYNDERRRRMAATASPEWRRLSIPSKSPRKRRHGLPNRSWGLLLTEGEETVAPSCTHAPRRGHRTHPDSGRRAGGECMRKHLQRFDSGRRATYGFSWTGADGRYTSCRIGNG